MYFQNPFRAPYCYTVAKPQKYHTEFHFSATSHIHLKMGAKMGTKMMICTAVARLPPSLSLSSQQRIRLSADPRSLKHVHILLVILWGNPKKFPNCLVFQHGSHQKPPSVVAIGHFEILKECRSKTAISRQSRISEILEMIKSHWESLSTGKPLARVKPRMIKAFNCRRALKA